MNDLIKSLKFKMVALSVLVFAVFVGLMSFLFFEIFKQRQNADFDLNLYNHAVDLANSIDITLLGDIVVSPQGGAQRRIIPFSLGSSVIQLRDLKGRVIVSSPGTMKPMPFDPRQINEVLNQRGLFQTFRDGNKEYRSVLIPLRRPPFDPLILQVASSTSELVRERRQIRFVTFLFFGVSVLAVAGVSFWTIRQSLASVYRIINSARALEPQTLSSRLPVPQESELRDLVVALNELLGRVDKALQSQEQFSADASHQLKTPLAIMRAELDVFKAQPRSEAETKEMISSLSTDLVKLTELVDNLLLMARFDSGTQALQKSLLRVDEILMETLSQLQFFANEKKVSLQFEIPDNTDGEDLEIQADGNLIRILFFNLIENSIKHSQSGKTVKVRASSHDSAVRVDVEDEGTGIEEKEMSRIFERFHRAGSKQHELPGVGLGLSIARKIADLHDSSLSVESQIGQGTTFTWKIKKI